MKENQIFCFFCGVMFVELLDSLGHAIRLPGKGLRNSTVLVTVLLKDKKNGKKRTESRLEEKRENEQ